MVFIFVPAAAAGYMYYKKQKAEREARENQESEQSEGDHGSDDCGSSVENDKPTEIQRKSQDETKPRGPVGKFLFFCENLEKECQKAQERKRREAIEAAFDEAYKETFGDAKKKEVDLFDVQAVQTLDSVDTSTSEDEENTKVEESLLDEAESQEEMVSTTEAEKCEEVKKEAPSISGEEFDDDQIAVKTVGHTPNRPRIATE